VPLARLEVASVDARGSTPYFAEQPDGTKLFVKALGDDERSADLMFRFYRRIQPHDFGDMEPFSSLRRAVEHEALVALAARDFGVRTPQLLAFATAEPNGYVLAYEGIDGKSLDAVEPARAGDDVLLAIWGLVADLRRHRIAHRDLRLANIFLHDSGEVWLIDFGFSELAASDHLLATDAAELLASSCLWVGAERAVAAASRTTDAATLTQAMERLRPWALSGATRTAYKQNPKLMDDLRHQLDRALTPVHR
jgi:glycosyltransferase 2 family protein